MTQPPSDPPTPPTRRPAIRERARVGGLLREKRSPRILAASVLLHVAVAFILLQALTFGHGLSFFLDFGKESPAPEERLTYVQTQPTPAPEPVRPVVQPRAPAVTPVAPEGFNPATPQAPATPPAVARADTGSGGSPAGVGNGVGALDPNLRGVKPDLADPRVWQGPVGNGVAPARDGADRLDSIMGFAITSARDSLDSLARAQGKYDRAPGDWTGTDKNGRKWGWDQQGIRLGKVTIPNALLGLLPMNAATGAGLSGNFTSIQNERRLSLAREDIQRMSERSLGDAEFRKIANELRDRRERERRERLRAPSASVAPAAPMRVKEPPKNPPKSGDR